MKKTILFAIMAVVLGFTACSKEGPSQTETTQKGMILRAAVEQPTDSKATFTDNEGVWHFDFAEGDVIKVTNSEIGYDNFYTFTYDGEKFVSADAVPTDKPARWHAYFPSNEVSLVGQSVKWEDIADMYVMTGSTPYGSGDVTGEDGLSITMEPKVAILKIINEKGNIDINVLRGDKQWVSGYKTSILFTSSSLDLYDKETKQTLLSTTETGTYYIAVPAGWQLVVKDGDEVLKSTGTSGLAAGKYYELAIALPTFTVTFDANGHGTAPLALDKVPYGSTIDKPADPTAGVYTFCGWYKDKACTAEWNFDSDIVTSNITLYANWELIGVLPGIFTVNDSGKKVCFSQGNLYYDGSEFNFETNQYDTPANGTWSTNHISHFYWSKTASVAYAMTYSDEYIRRSDDVFFTNATATTAKEGFIVHVDGKGLAGWRILSSEEWQYLFNSRIVNGGTGEDKSYSLNITYGGMMGLVLYPDDYSGSALVSGNNYTDDFPTNCVFLPAAGERVGSDVRYVSDSGYFWSSSAFDYYGAFRVIFFTPGSFFFDFDPSNAEYREFGHCVRLIKECQ